MTVELAPLLVSRAALAKLARCTKPNVTQLCKKALAPACVGQMVNTKHPAAAAYLTQHGVRDDELEAAAQAEPPRPPLISPAILRLELGMVLGLHDPRYRAGEPVKLGRLLRALRRMHAQLALNAAAGNGDEAQAP